MKVEEFVSGAKDERDIGKYIRENVKFNDYVSFAEKKLLAENAIRSANTQDGKIIKDKVKEYLLKEYVLFYAYTDLEISVQSWVEEYDLLVNTSLLRQIERYIPSSELEEMQRVWEFTEESFWWNETSWQGALGKVLDGVAEKVAEGQLTGESRDEISDEKERNV